MYDVIVIGAGIGGLTAASRLAKQGLKVLLLEKIHHIGGTSYTFRRGSYTFPIGPLAFAHPDLVRGVLAEIGVTEKLEFRRAHYQLISPSINIVYSRSFRVLKSDLKKKYPNEALGIDGFFKILVPLARAISDIFQWYPEDAVSEQEGNVALDIRGNRRRKLRLLDRYAGIPCRKILKTFISDHSLFRFMGSQGTHEPEMSMFLLATMWHLMCEVGIWYPSCGIDGINNFIYRTLVANGGKVRLNTPVLGMTVEKNRVTGVRTADGECYRAKWVVSNTDYKKTFIELIDPGCVPEDFLQLIRQTPFSGSEFCVYLGVNPDRVDFSKIRTQHLFYRKTIRTVNDDLIDDFDNREIEIYLLSRSDPLAAPPGKLALILRVGMPYEWFSDWKTGEKKRKPGYREYKDNLARKLIQTVESVIPGLSESIDFIEVATPLTYEDWGQRFKGSIAGWSWDAVDSSVFPGNLLIRTPIENLLMVGIYAVSELILGGVPTSMVTALKASDMILNSCKRKAGS